MLAFRSVVSVLLRALGDFLYTLEAKPIPEDVVREVLHLRLGEIG